MNCTPECIAATARRAREREDYQTAWPHHCRDCGGWGGIYSSFDPSPAGVSLSPGSMTDFDPCRACADQGLCPRCRLPMDAPLQAVKRELNELVWRVIGRLGHPVTYPALRWLLARSDRMTFVLKDEGVTCRHCGWRDGDEGEPAESECYCWESELYGGGLV